MNRPSQEQPRTDSPWPAVVDGEVRADGRVDVLVLGAGFQHGEGLFETLPVLGGQPVYLDRHARRLRDGAAELGLAPVPAPDTWRRDLEVLMEASGRRDLASRLFLFLDGARVRRAVAAGPLPGVEPPADVGLVAPAFDGPRPLARLKTLNYLVPRVAHRIGAAAGHDEVLFRGADGTVLEGTRSTLFIITRGVVRTAPLSLPILPGVTREVLLEIAREAGIPVREEPFGLDQVLAADEAFLSASLRGVRAVRAVAGRPMREAPGPVTRQLQVLYVARVRKLAGLAPPAEPAQNDAV